MTLHIVNSEAQRIATQLAEVTGHSVEEEVLEALRERAKRLKNGFDPQLYDDLKAISQRSASLPVLDARQPDDILYDNNGLPK